MRFSRLSALSGAVAVLSLSAACGSHKQPAAAKPPADLPEPFWASDAGVRPNRAAPISEQLPAGRATVQLSEAEARTLGATRRDLDAPMAAAGRNPSPTSSADLATPTRVVTGLYSFTSHQENTTTLQPFDLTTFPIKALVPNAAGGLDTLTGVGHSDGTFSISNVPVGNYWLVIGRAYLWTSNDHVEWVSEGYGRPDAVAPVNLTNLALTAGNLSSWTTTDDLLWSVPNQGYQTSLVGVATAGLPTAGSTALTGYTFDFAAAGLGLLDAAKGDQAYLCQLTTRTLGTERYRALGKVWNLPALTMVDGTAASASGAFLDIAQTSSMRLNWRRSALASMASQVNPAASVVGTEIGLWTTPLGLNEGLPGTAFQLLTYDSGPVAATTDVDLGDAPFGNPFPSAWSQLAETYYTYSISYLAPGATTPTTLLRSSYTATNVLPTAAAPIGPLLSPVLNPRINGKDLFQNQLAVGTTPTLAWDAPATGSPTGYFVRVSELKNSAGASTLISRAVFRTALRGFTVPPGILTAGSTYVITISAVKNTGVAFGEYPLKAALPYSAAPMASAIIAP